jgi:HEAT repeats
MKRRPHFTLGIRVVAALLILHSRSMCALEGISFADLLASDRDYSENELLSLSRQRNAAVRQFAVEQLGERTSLTPAALSILIDRLADRDDGVRFEAMASLMRIGKSATGALAKALSNVKKVAEFTYRSKALNRERTIQISVSDLAFAVLHSTRGVDADVLLAAYRRAPAKSGSSQLNTAVALPKNMDTASRLLAVLEGLSAAEATPTLVDGLRGDDIALKIALTRMFGRWGEFAATAVESLRQNVASFDDRVSTEAAAALAQIQPQGQLALYGLAQHPDARVRAVSVAVFPLNRTGVAEVVSRGLLDFDRRVNAAALARISHDEFNTREQFPSRLQLLRLVPGSTLPQIVLLSSNPDPKIRALVFQALYAWWEARKQDLDQVVEHLMVGISDPDPDARTVAYEQLAMLTSETTVPELALSLPRIVAPLHDPATDAQRDALAPILTILTHLPIPESSYKAVAEALIGAKGEGLEIHESEVHALLAAHPPLAEVALEAFIDRYPDPKLLDFGAFDTLEQFANGSEKALQFLGRLLDYSNPPIRTRSAVLLSKYDKRETRVLDVLEEAARRFEGYGGLESDAADALAKAGAEGVDRLMAIVQDPKVSNKTRGAIIYYPLAEIANQDTRAAKIILETAAQHGDPEIQDQALWALRSIQNQPEAVRSTLDAAFQSKLPKLRKTVVLVHKEANAPLGDFPERALADSDADVRTAAVELLPLLPQGDSRRVTLLQSALSDKSAAVQKEALREAAHPWS